MNVHDAYWLAGLFEGDGCFGHARFSPVAEIEMTDPDIIEKVARLIHTRIAGPFVNPKGKKRMYRAKVYGARAVGVMMTLYPMLGLRRQAKIREILLWWKTRPGRGHKTRAS